MVAWYAIVAAIACFVAFGFIARCYGKIKQLSEGTDEMVVLARIIRESCVTFLKTEFKTIWLVVFLLAIVITCFVEKYAGITFVIGALMSTCICWIGMKCSTYANVRTANTARTTLSVWETTKVALMGGSVSGLGVQAFGLFGLIVVMAFFVGSIDPEATSHGIFLGLPCNPTITRIMTYSLGCSIVAMFNRVAGGNFTKSADISSDIIGKVIRNMDEDDCRIPNVASDFAGDNVNDNAGNGSDLLESFTATPTGSISIAMFLALIYGTTSPEFFRATWTFPFLLAAAGLISCVFGIWMVLRSNNGGEPAKELNKATYFSAGGTIILSLLASFVVFGKLEMYDEFRIGWASPWIASVLGIISGVAVGAITERYTSTDFEPTRKLARIAREGAAFVATKGDAIGSRSAFPETLVIVLALIGSYLVCGFYGVAISALGMLSFVGTTVSIDAFGPVADNAGGIAESCHLDEKVREITDKLDSVGNTTAAIGKGFAICSAAFATVSLIISYVGTYTAAGQMPTLNFAAPMIIGGGILGGAIIKFFCAILTDNTIESATVMADEGSKRMDSLEKYGLKAEDATLSEIIRIAPDYYTGMVEIATKNALKKMLGPSVLALFIPVIGGFIFGPEFVGGLLIGETIVAIPEAIFMGNSGGAFDNAKKYIEAGEVPGSPKGSDAHKAAVIGDTIGDTRKDVVGVALDIFIKMSSTVANTMAPLFISLSLFR